MPRRLRLQTNEMAMVEMYLIYNEGGVWEEEWRPLQDLGFLDLAEVPREMMEQALVGYTKPLVEALGPTPKGRLLGLPKESRLCGARNKCAMHEPKRCSHLLKKMPWCFEPDGDVEGTALRLLTILISLWREGVYVILIREF